MKTQTLRSLLLLLTCVILLGAFCGCGSENPYYNQPLKTETSLDEAMATQIADDFNTYMSENDQGSSVTYRAGSCYGIFDGYVVLDFEGGVVSTTVADEVAGIIFYLWEGREIWTWKDGTILTLQQAYDQGALTVEQIKAVYDARNNGHIQTDEAGNPTMQFRQNIAEDLENFFYRMHPNKELYSPHVNYQAPAYCKIIDECAVVLDFGELTSQAYSSETVAGVTFYYTTGAQMSVWKDGEFYSLQEAYDQELLTKTDLKRLAKENNAWRSLLEE